MEIRERCTAPPSPAASPARPSSTPPASICVPEASAGCDGSGACRAYSVPAAHDMAQPTQTRPPRRSVPPPPGETRSPTPPRPTSRPVQPTAESRRPKTTRSKSASQSGIVATRSTATPESTRCSAHVIPPFPIVSNAPPATNAAAQPRRLTRRRGESA